MRRMSIFAASIIVILALVFSTGASPKAYKYIPRNLIASSYVISPNPNEIYVTALNNALCVSVWTFNGNLLIPERSTIPNASGWADSVITIPAGGYQKFELNGNTRVRLYLRTANWYSTTDSNSTAVLIEVN